VFYKLNWKNIGINEKKHVFTAKLFVFGLLQTTKHFGIMNCNNNCVYTFKKILL